MSRHHEVIVVGAGVSGVCAAVELRRAGVSDVLVLEKAETYGGTWRANTYPGCACDVPSGLYSYSFAPNAEWSRLFGTQPEILDYVGRVAREHGLDAITRFGVEMLDARWDATDRRWRVRTNAGEFSATFLVAAAGPWNEPKIPGVPGLDEFPGEVFHSARWNHDYDLRGKRVAVIGSGASAVQFVPQIQPRVAALHLFQRTAHWVLPKLDHPVPELEKQLMRRVPFAHTALRGLEYAVMDGVVGTAFHRPKPLMHGLQAIGRAYLRLAVPDPELRRKLTPGYLLGCKRILFSNNYLQSLTRPNVAVHATAVDRIDGSTVVGADDSAAEVDAVILGTGFHILDMPLADLVHGADGRSLAQHWGGSPEAYRGTVVSGFPNLCIMLGPSLGTGHSSAFTIAEAQVAFLVRAVTTARREGWSSFEVRPRAQADYVDRVQAALGGTAYNADSCRSYYIDANGRNSFSWPWSTGRLVRTVSRFDPADFTVTVADDIEVPA
ncbi:NAD(P)/FAD-dependent oxidoreductase [Nocardia farcinica]|uniref:flavin-containing monooxygenase n=1 Tax=Nocardia farcinica TaxID=37329 RepID=UPI0018939A1D|nr:NAD(P)/FAD-dependent oxidoreductase [Nocardia farcinica]MBF6261344.1 NAD(P)/FAD-dependent oxidoreductase [Nocardia farcinica]MBF6278988.1 NAD(P)/FAD-dependent oxidoreductase [Nocardia farcinica]MBF6294455.1 NAD(P)/FAD-dependent oxidoreductase [Nocardia farcinica]MBF6304354.1 NAD(P)/FAD-dependent oxidoreductase [Nocardia farcinica]MBF6381321.1 NAD(P)/FAD-dependent oxidoreductase [Nocardia farcinica]